MLIGASQAGLSPSTLQDYIREYTTVVTLGLWGVGKRTVIISAYPTDGNTDIYNLIAMSSRSGIVNWEYANPDIELSIKSVYIYV